MADGECVFHGVLRTEAAGDNQWNLADCTGFFSVIDEKGFAFAGAVFGGEHLRAFVVTTGNFNKINAHF